MNITTAIRRYIKDHPGEIIDASFLHKTLFPLVEYHTFLKILSRLSNEGLIRAIGRGVYIPANVNNGQVSALVRDYYSDHTNGMTIGAALYYDLSIIVEKPKAIEIYTNRLDNGKRKCLLGHKLIGANVIFDDVAKKLITLLELIENQSSIAGMDNDRYAEVVNNLRKASYTEALLGEVTNAIPYKDSTIIALREILK